MDQQESASRVQQQVVNVQQTSSNGLGTAGFVTSLVGWVTCGVLCPVGLVMSFVAVFKKPRGFAIAGLIIGGLGSTFLIVVGFGIVAGVLGLGAAAAVGVAAVGEEVRFLNAARIIQQEYRETGALPTGPDGTAAIILELEFKPDEVRYEPSENGFTITAPGSDGVFETADDKRRDYPLTSEQDSQSFQAP